MKKKDLLSGLLGALVSVLIFGFFYYFLDQEYIDKFLPSNKVEGIVFFVTLFVGPLVAIFFHELGHLFVGLIQGQKCKLFVVGFLGIIEANGKISFYLNTNLAHFGGLVVMIPKRIDDIEAEVFARILLAGPLFSLFLSLICVLLFIYTDTPLNSFFGFTSLVSVGLFWVTTIPDKSGMMFTDRKRYQRLKKKGITQDAEIALYEIVCQSSIENTFKRIDINKTFLLEADSEIEMKFWAAYFRYMYYAENEREVEKKKEREQLEKLKYLVDENSWRTLSIE